MEMEPSTEAQMEMEVSKRLRSAVANERPRWRRAKRLFDSITASTEGKNLSDPHDLASLPFPFLGHAPHRFNVERRSGVRYFQYMGRTGYVNFRNAVLGLVKESYYDKFGDLPVRADKDPQHFDEGAALWGTMGSGKSFILAALACDLIASFSRSKDSDGMAFQRQRAVYLPDCGLLVGLSTSCTLAFQYALSLSYADDAETLGRIDMLSDETSLTNFFMEEADKGVCIYLLVDQVNALDPSTEEAAGSRKAKAAVHSLIRKLAFHQFFVQSASVNNNNAKNWSSKQLDIAVVFHHGGLDDNEYRSWKEHFATSGGSPTPLAQLTEEQELRVKDATGCVPLYLQCWNDASMTPENAWQKFTSLPEISHAHAHLASLIGSQLCDKAQQQRLVEMYLRFMTQDKVFATPKDYDCRYLYVEEPNRIGRCVCGVYRDCIAEILQCFRRSIIANREWRQAITSEAMKDDPNFALLGFMVEQEMISEILVNGIPLYAKTTMKCDKVVYFTSGNEARLEIEEGCILYLPSAFNYHRVDAVIRQYNRSGTLHRGPPPRPKQLISTYSKLQLHVAGVQISLGSLQNHLSSEDEFCSPEAMKVWYPNWDSKNVARWFMWYVLQSDMDKHTRDAVELSPCSYGNGQVRGKTRAARVQGLDHVTIFRPLEQYEPCLKWMRKTQSKT